MDSSHPEFLKKNGDVRNLKAYRIAEIISVATELFIDRFIDKTSRTRDQMTQAARSCKQNIVEGSEAAMTSKETEIKLTNVARASLGELYEDYLDYLRFHSMECWSLDHPRLKRLRAYLKTKEFEKGYKALCLRLDGEAYCNMMLTLIKQDQYLLERMLITMQERFKKSGGIREQLSQIRRDYIKKQGYPFGSSPSNPKKPE